MNAICVKKIVRAIVLHLLFMNVETMTVYAIA